MSQETPDSPGADNALRETQNWASRSHRELYQAVHADNDPGRVGELADDWVRLSREMSEASQNMAERLRDTETGWRGRAADAARSAIQKLADWNDEAGRTAGSLGDRISEQGRIMERARAEMPEPVEGAEAMEAVAAATFASGNLEGFARASMDARALREQSSSAHQQAVEVMTRMENDSRVIDGDTPRFVPPPNPIRDEQERAQLQPMSQGERLAAVPASGGAGGQATPFQQGTPAPQGAPTTPESAPAAPDSAPAARPMSGQPGALPGGDQPGGGVPGAGPAVGGPGGAEETRRLKTLQSMGPGTSGPQSAEPPSVPKIEGYNPGSPGAEVPGVPKYGDPQPGGTTPQGVTPQGVKPMANIPINPGGGDTLHHPRPVPGLDNNPMTIGGPRGGPGDSRNRPGDGKNGLGDGKTGLGDGKTGLGDGKTGPGGPRGWSGQLPPLPGPGGGPGGGLGGAGGGLGGAGAGAGAGGGMSGGAGASGGQGQTQPPPGGSSGAGPVGGSGAGAGARGPAGPGGASGGGAMGGAMAPGMGGGARGGRGGEDEERRMKYVQGGPVVEVPGGDLPPPVIGERRRKKKQDEG
ncbi:WXG100 family type VII secretion target [Saccharopolyspora taberi]|uniref:PPE domain-containing protein n=1 Tax=Saccharopolyspora taberi TaxID=60895 RepID=A0ABN3VAH8_9PSEU